MVSLIAMREHMMYPVLCNVEPGCGNLTPHTHNGEEMVYVLSGVLEYRLNDEPPYILRPGDTFYYRGSDLHSWQNISSKPAKILWVHSAIAKE
jgi:quercetin dioxygenase-like cupin family protein